MAEVSKKRFRVDSTIGNVAMIYYPYSYRLNNTDAYLLWYTDDSTGGDEADGVLLDDTGHLVTFGHLDDLRVFTDSRNLTLVAENPDEPLDLDSVERWIVTARKTSVDCLTFFNAWNLFSDLISTVEGKPTQIDDQRQGRIYNKLFWGNNLFALTPPGKHYVPLWTKSEVGKLRNVLATGMALFHNRLRPSHAMALGSDEETVR